METIKIKYHADIEKIEKIPVGDWIDLRSAETVELKSGEYRKISLGVSMRLPYGYEANIVPRGSTFEQFGILQTNSFGVVDNSYCGNNDVWKFPALAMRDTVIRKGDKICQFRLNKIMSHYECCGELYFEETDDLGGNNRGGFGTTGRN